MIIMLSRIWRIKWIVIFPWIFIPTYILTHNYLCCLLSNCVPKTVLNKHFISVLETWCMHSCMGGARPACLDGAPSGWAGRSEEAKLQVVGWLAPPVIGVLGVDWRLDWCGGEVWWGPRSYWLSQYRLFWSFHLSGHWAFMCIDFT